MEAALSPGWVRTGPPGRRTGWGTGRPSASTVTATPSCSSQPSMRSSRPTAPGTAHSGRRRSASASRRVSRTWPRVATSGTWPWKCLLRSRATVSTQSIPGNFCTCGGSPAGSSRRGTRSPRRSSHRRNVSGARPLIAPPIPPGRPQGKGQARRGRPAGRARLSPRSTPCRLGPGQPNATCPQPAA